MDDLGNTPGVRGNPGWKRCVAGGSSTPIGRPQGHVSDVESIAAFMLAGFAVAQEHVSFPKKTADLSTAIHTDEATADHPEVGSIA